MIAALESGMLLVESAGDDEAAFAVVDAADRRTPRVARAWVSLRRVDEHEWALTGIDTKAEFEGRGYSTALIENVRRWAGANGLTVRTRNAMPDVYGFYVKCCCVQVTDDEGDIEYLVAPVGACH